MNTNNYCCYEVLVIDKLKGQSTTLKTLSIMEHD